MPLLAPVNSVKAGAAPRLLHVTDVFPGPKDPDSPAMIAACQRGHIVHQITEDFDRGVDIAIEPVYSGYLIAWQNYRTVTGAKPVEIELPIGNQKLGFCGRLDRVMAIGRETWIVDIKSGSPWPTHALQTAAYEHGYRDHAGIKKAKKIHRACVYLRPDGTYTTKLYKSVHDLNTFLAYLRVARWEIEHGLRPMPKER